MLNNCIKQLFIFVVIVVQIFFRLANAITICDPMQGRYFNCARQKKHTHTDSFKQLRERKKKPEQEVKSSRLHAEMVTLKENSFYVLVSNGELNDLFPFYFKSNPLELVAFFVLDSLEL